MKQITFKKLPQFEIFKNALKLLNYDFLIVFKHLEIIELSKRYKRLLLEKENLEFSWTWHTRRHIKTPFKHATKTSRKQTTAIGKLHSEC